MAKLKEVTKLRYGSFVNLSEAKKLPDDGTGLRRYLVTLLTEGKGNPRDKHYYSQKCIDDPATAVAFNGKPCFINHSDAIEEQTRPERNLRDQAGWYSECHAEGNALKGVLTLAIGKQGDELEGFIETAFAFAKENPGQNYCGISIAAAGPTSLVDLDGEEWKQVDRIVEADSADAVTKPARGGQFEKKLEAFRETAESGVMKIMKALRKMAEAGPVDPKVLKRMTDNAISALNGNQVESQGAVEMKKTEQALKEARKKAFPAQSEEEAMHMAKSLAGFHAGNAESETDPAKKAIHMAQAEKYKSMCGEGDGDMNLEPGDKAMVTKADPSDDDADTEAEEARKEAEAKAAKEAEDDSEEGEAKKKMEALRKENVKLRGDLAAKEAYVKSAQSKVFETTLKESGLPESWFGSVRILCEGKTLRESKALIEAEVEKYENTFRESGFAVNSRKSGRVDSLTESHKDTDGILEEFGL